MNVVVEKAHGYAKPTIRNLMQLYIYDMSEFKHREVGSQGLYHYKDFDNYWSQPDHYPFLVRVGKSLAGFAFVRFIDGTADMAEFFVMREHRRRGVGAIAAKQLFDMFPGQWETRQEPKNFAAQTFWRRVIQEYTDGEFEDTVRDDEQWRGSVQRFDSRRQASVTRSLGEG